MIFADKLIELRRKSGWTQEELSEKMDVSRQSIAKWEGAQSIPELSKIIKLSELFGVSTDYLLKDSMETVELVEDGKDETAYRRVSMEEANSFLSSRKKAALPIAIGTMLCVLSPICVLILSALSENPVYGISEGIAAGVGMCTLFILVAIAVVIFISTGNKNSQYEYLEKEIIDTEYGVEGMVKERRLSFKSTYDTSNIIGTLFCILAVIPIFIGIIFDENNDILIISMFAVLLALVSIGLLFFIKAGVVWASFEKLLQDGDFSKEKKKEQNSIIGAVSTAYWLITTAVFLAYSFTTNEWKSSWIVWVIAGVLYPAVQAILRAICGKGRE